MSAQDVQAIIEQYGRPAYDVAMRQVLVNAIAETVVGVLLLALVAACALRIRFALRQPKPMYGDRLLNDGLAFASTFIVPLAALIIVGIAYDLLTFVINPEWAAIKMLLP